jgi:hypothetical protein
MEIPGFEKEAKIVDQPAALWNTIAELYAKYKIGMELRYTLTPTVDPVNNPQGLPLTLDSPTGKVIVDKLMKPFKPTGVVDILAHIQIEEKMHKDVRMRWIPERLVWRSLDRVSPYEPGSPAVFYEGLQGNLKMCVGLDVDAVSRGEIPIPPLFEWDRDDAPKTKMNTPRDPSVPLREWMIPRFIMTFSEVIHLGK